MKKGFLIALLFIQGVFCEEEVAVFMPAPASGSCASSETKSKILEMFNQFSLWMGNILNLQFKTDIFLKNIETAPHLLKDFEKKHGFFSPIQPLTGNATIFKDDVKLASDYLIQLDTITSDPDRRRFYINEFISKVIAYRFLEKNDRLLIPSFEKPGVFYHYKVTHVFNLGLKMPAFGLEADEKEANSIILFRGTDLHLTKAAALASVVADLDVFGPGYTAFFLAKNEIQAFLENSAKMDKKVISLGYSLGGILSMYTQLFFPSFMDIKNSAAFNPPGFQKKLLKLAEETGALQQLPVYVNQNDAVSKWGFLAGSVEVLSAKTRLKPLEAHTFLMGAQDHLSFHTCDLSIENKRHLYLFAP